MAFRHGRYAEVTVNTKALSAYCDSLDFSVDIDTSDTSTYGGTWKTAVGGQAGAKLDMGGSYDPTVTVGPAAVLSALIGAAPFAVLVYPGGNTGGQVSRSFNAILTNYKESSPIGGKVTFTASMITTGTVTLAPI